MAMMESEKEMIFEALRRVLKTKNLTYKDLAKKIHISEPSIKRIFSTKECTLERLVEICSALEVSLFALIEAAKTISPPDYSLSAETESFFAAHFHYFVFFRKLCEQTHLKKLKDQEKIDTASFRKYLKKLEDLNLIEVISDSEARLKNKGYLKLAKNGSLQKAVHKNWVAQMAQIVQNKTDADHNIFAMSTGLSDSNRSAFVKDLENLLDRYRRTGFIDQTFQNYDSVGVSIVIGPYRVGTLGTIAKI